MDFTHTSFHAFKYDNSYYLLDNNFLISCRIEQNVYEALISKDSSLLTDQQRSQFELLAQEGLFFNNDLLKNNPPPQYDMVIISMAISHGCNLNCRYCFADAGDNFKGEHRTFTNKTTNAAIGFLLNDPYFSKFNYYRINLVSGGEPFLNKKSLYEFVKTAFRIFDSHNKHLYIWLSTNGTLLDENDMEFLSKYNVGYGISIDGNEESNDKLRVYKNGTGTYQDIVNTIKCIQTSPKLPKKFKELWGLMVYTKKNSNLYDNISHLRDLGFSTVQMRFVRSNDPEIALDREHFNILRDNLLRFIEQIFKTAICGDDSLLRLISNEHDYIGKIIERIVGRIRYEVRCSAGSYMFSFAADGNIYPCDSFVGNPEFIIGNFHTGMDEEQLTKYKDISIHKRAKCSKCWAKYICGGDCYHNSYIVNKNILDPDTVYCTLIKNVIESVIANTNLYQQNNPDGFNRFKNFLATRDKLSSK